MIKKLASVLVMLLAINFLAVAGGAAWLWKSGRLGKEQVAKIKEVLFPPEASPATQTAAEAEDPAATQPSLRLAELLERASGRTAVEQVESIQQSFDAQMAQLDRRYRELQDLQRQVEAAKEIAAADRAKIDADQKALTARQAQAQKDATDKGFQDSLNLYSSLPSKQVKTVFMSLDDDIVVRYLQAMQPRTASRIVKEFKAPDEVARIQRVLERMRLSQASTGP